MSEESGSGSICRDDNCDRLDVHPPHLVLNKGRKIVPHHRPNGLQRPLWQRDDPRGLTGAVARATSKSYPMLFSHIVRDVRDDYGPCTERTVYRHLRKLVQRGHVIKLDLQLAFAAYIRPRSRLLADPEGLRDYMLGTLELHPATKERAAVK